jgi:hypothetical protein
VSYSKALAKELCERLAAGERWRNLAGTEGMPSHAAPYRWARTNPEFRADFQLAKRVGADMRADRVLEIAEGATNATLNVDKFHVGSLKWHVERETKLWGPQPDEPDLGAGRTLIIRVRQFERVERPDGGAFMREILPNGETRDLD